jgi:hypothetical protein
MDMASYDRPFRLDRNELFNRANFAINEDDGDRRRKSYSVPEEQR